MRILSTKLSMHDTFSASDFYNVIVGWLKGYTASKSVAEQLEKEPDFSQAHIETPYYKLDTIVSRKAKHTYWACKLSNEFHQQLWDTEIILEDADGSKTVYFHIDCSRDITQFFDTPDMRSEVIRAFLKSGHVLSNNLPLGDKPMRCEGQAEQALVKAVKGEHDFELPVVMLSNFFGSMGYAVDEDKLARKLAGLACVILCDNEDTRYIESKAQGRKCPYNGSIAIYMAGGKPRILRQKDAFQGMSLDQLVIGEVQRFVTAKVDANAPTFKQMLMEQIRADAEEKKELLDVAIDENDTLEEQLKQAKKKISELSQENRRLVGRVGTLEAALQATESDGLLLKAPITEFFDGEQHDLLITLLKNALQNNAEDTRVYELVQKLLEVNAEKGNGRVIFETVKAVLSNGSAPRDSDFAKLKAVGFELVSEQNHYKLVFKGNEKYWFPLFKTPSDHRGGKNLVSDINKHISIYR